MKNAWSAEESGGKTIEFVGVGPVGKKRSIDSFEYVVLGPVKRVDVAAPPDQDWMTLFNELAFTFAPIPGVSIRGANGLILLGLKNVLPLYFGIQAFLGSSKLVTALLSLEVESVVVSRVRASSVSSLDRNLPPSVRLGRPALRPS